jgi:hypothetical protein
MGLLLLIALWKPAPAKSRSWILAGRSGYSSTYHTQSWYDTLVVHSPNLLGNTWRVGQRLDLLRKELSSGQDLQQRNHRLCLAAEPVNRPWGWTLNLDGNESSVIESVDRRTIWSRVLIGGLWRRGRSVSVGLQAGGTASRHRAASETANDQGFAQRLTAEWNTIRTRNDGSDWLDAHARLAHAGDQRKRLPSHETNWSWDMRWLQSADSIALEWDEQWRDTRFYPSPDRFDRIGRQSHRYRIAQIEWTHAPCPDGLAWLPLISNNLGWRMQVAAGLDRNTYGLSEGDALSGGLPGDVDTKHRSYGMGLSRGLSGMQFDVDYRYRWTEDNFSESRRDQTSETGELDAMLRWRLTSADSIGIHSVFRVTTYSVPGEASFFTDRDQGERVVDVYWWHRFSEVLTLRPVFSYRGFRQVFISGELSANNNTDNVYLLAPAIYWMPLRSVAMSQRFGIRAHYRFFDFERTDPGGRGTLYRKAESVTGASIDGVSGTSWLVQYTYRYEDFGGLFDRDGWVQSVDWDRRSHLIDGQLIWRPRRGLTIRPALGLERKKSFNHRRIAEDVRRIEDESFRRTNISMTAEWNAQAGYEIQFVIARRVQQFGAGPRERDDRWELSVTKGI